jgi:hypothetical protein
LLQNSPLSLLQLQRQPTNQQTTTIIEFPSLGLMRNGTNNNGDNHDDNNNQNNPADERDDVGQLCKQSISVPGTRQ